MFNGELYLSLLLELLMVVDGTSIVKNSIFISLLVFNLSDLVGKI